MMEFNNKLYSLRKQKGFSQEELANRLFEVSLDELVLDKTPEVTEKAEPSEQIVRSELYSDIKENVLTDENKKKAKKGLKIAAIALGVFVLIDIISFIVYVAIFGLPG